MKALGLIAAAVLVGFGLLCAAYLIPQEAIRDKTAYSVSILRDEAYSPTTALAGWFPAVVKDSTDIDFLRLRGLRRSFCRAWRRQDLTTFQME